MKMIEEIRSRPRLKKLLSGGLIFLVLFSVTGFFVLPPVLKSVLIKRLSEQLHREVAIEKIKVNPFMLSLTVKGFVMKELNRPETFFSFDQLYVNLQLMSLIRRGLILSEIRVENPYLNIIRGEDMRYNFSDLIEKKGPQQAASKPFRFSLNNIQILDGSIDFFDGPKHTKHTARNLTVKIPFLSDLPYYTETYVKPLLEGKFNGRPVSFTGVTKPFAGSLETSFNIFVKDLDIPYYLAYLPFRPNFQVLSGLFDTKTTLSFIQYSNRPPQMKLAGDVAFREIHVVDREGAPLLKLPLFAVAIADAELISRNIHLSRVSIESPEIFLMRDTGGKMNIQSLVNQENPEPPGDVREDGPASSVLRVDEAIVDKGVFTFTDYFKDSSFKTVLDVNIKIDHFSTARDEKTAVSLSLKTEADETLSLASNLTVLPLSSEGTVEFKKIELGKYAPYYSENLLFDVKDAQLDIKTHYVFMKDEKAPVTRLTGLEAALNSLRLKQKDDKDDFLSIPLTAVKDADVDLEKKEVLIGGLYSQKGVMSIKRSSDGKWNVGSLIREGEWSLRNLLKKPAAAELQKGQKQKGIPERPWQLTIKDLTAEDYRITFNDAQPSEPVTMVADRIKLKEENLSTIPNAKAKVSFSSRINKTGSVSAKGSFVRNPVSANLQMNVKAIDIVPFQPYFTDKVKIIVTGGDISSKGNLVLGSSKTKEVQMTYRGEASLTKFASVDKINADDFLKFDSLYFSKMDIGYKPVRINIKEVALTDFYSRLIINPDGSLNVQGIVEKEEAAKGPVQSAEAPQTADNEKESKEGKMITVDTVTLQNGTINFSDRHIKPNYSANLLEIGGRISGLSSAEDKFADVNLKGKLDNYAPLEISGKINPLRDDLYVDLKADFKDMDLSPVTPYSGRYVGYTIQKGKLSLGLQYLIVKKKLDAQNRVFLDQLTLGDQVDSPEATKLPVKLAIALLKNRKGEIELNLPVTGRIDDPKFRLGSVIVKILVNILVKAATSPFALLGAIFGGGEELSYIDFDYGSFKLDGPGTKKLDTLVKALYDRPALKLEIEGHVDVEKDREGLRQYLFHRKIKTQKLKDMVKAGIPAVPVDEVKIEQNEYARYLKMAYKAEKFPKPRNIIGMAKDLPVPEMEKLMLTHLEIKDDDLRQLASQRALNVKEYILKSKQVEPERVFLVEPKSLQPEKKEKLRDSRVDFRLK